ncbi:unnamed protein product, partial [Allacma fusca]
EEDEGEIMSTFANDPRRPKKRPRQEHNWRRNEAKAARLKGTEFRDEMDQVVVKGRKMKNLDCSCGCDKL